MFALRSAFDGLALGPGRHGGKRLVSVPWGFTPLEFAPVQCPSACSVEPERYSRNYVQLLTTPVAVETCISEPDEQWMLMLLVSVT